MRCGGVTRAGGISKRGLLELEVSLDWRSLEDGRSTEGGRSCGFLVDVVVDDLGFEPKSKSKAEVKLAIVGPCALRRGALEMWKPSGGAIIRRRLELGGR